MPLTHRIVAIVFCLIFAAGLARRRRAARMQQAFRAQGVGAPSTGPVLTGTAWSQHVAGGPALPPTAYSGGYAPAYMAPVRPPRLYEYKTAVLTQSVQPAGPPPALEEQYPGPPKYEGKVPEYSTSYAPPAGPPPGTPKYDV
jgi:hypothetical protein